MDGAANDASREYSFKRRKSRERVSWFLTQVDGVSSDTRREHKLQATDNDVKIRMKNNIMLGILAMLR